MLKAGTGDLGRVTEWARLEGEANGGRYAAVEFRRRREGARLVSLYT